MNRIEMLKQFVEKSPQDPFPRYGLAMEYKNSGDLEQAARTFGELIERHPEYTAAYLHAGGTLLSLGQKEEARRVFEAGITACQKKGDGHALGELEAALGAL